MSRLDPFGVEDVKASNLQVVLNLVRNAFSEAILPGFQRGVDKGRFEVAERSEG